MKIENDKIVEATELELYHRWLEEGWCNIVTFPEYRFRLEMVGVKITAGGEADDEKKTTLPT